MKGTERRSWGAAPVRLGPPRAHWVRVTGAVLRAAGRPGTSFPAAPSHLGGAAFLAQPPEAQVPAWVTFTMTKPERFTSRASTESRPQGH